MSIWGYIPYIYIHTFIHRYWGGDVSWTKAFSRNLNFRKILFRTNDNNIYVSYINDSNIIVSNIDDSNIVSNNNINVSNINVAVSTDVENIENKIMGVDDIK